MLPSSRLYDLRRHRDGSLGSRCTPAHEAERLVGRAPRLKHQPKLPSRRPARPTSGGVCRPGGPLGAQSLAGASLGLAGPSTDRLTPLLLDRVIGLRARLGAADRVEVDVAIVQADSDRQPERLAAADVTVEPEAAIKDVRGYGAAWTDQPATRI